MQTDREFSIVIPTYRRRDPLKACLTSISQLEYPRDHFEAVVVDDGSEEPAVDVIQAFESKMNVRLISQEHAGPAAARNQGAREARFSYIAFTDDDCAPLPDWLKKFSERFDGLPDHGIGGKILNGLPQNSYSAASQLLTEYLYSYYNSSPGGARFFASNNLAFPRKAFLDLGGFDVSFPRAAGEDREFCARWLRHGLHLTYAPEVKISHQHSLSLTSFLRQHLNYGRAAFHYHRVLGARRLERIPVEPLSFYFNMMRYPFQQLRHPAAVLSLLVMLSQIANGAGFFSEKIKA